MPVQTFTTLNDPFATLSGTFAYGINASGSIVGLYQESGTITNGFLLSGGTYTTLADPLATEHLTEAFGINDAGQIVGMYTDGNGDHGFLLSGGIYTTIDDPLALSLTTPQAINNAGQIVGYYQDRVGAIHGFFYNPAGGGSFTTLDDPLATAVNRVTEATGMNNAGQIVGWYTDSANVFHSFLLSGGTYTTIDVPGAIPGTTFAYDINDLGQIVGTYSANGASHGFLYSGGLYTNIDDPAATFTTPRSINNAGRRLRHERHQRQPPRPHVARLPRNRHAEPAGARRHHRRHGPADIEHLTHRGPVRDLRHRQQLNPRRLLAGPSRNRLGLRHAGWL
jgi:probable HAF family extracellular repeat protein